MAAGCSASPPPRRRCAAPTCRGWRLVVVSGGMIGPVLLMVGLARLPGVVGGAAAQPRRAGDDGDRLAGVSARMSTAGCCSGRRRSWPARWCCCPGRAGPVVFGLAWRAGDCRRLPRLGHRQQPDPQAERRRPGADRRDQRRRGRRGEPDAGARGWREAAGGRGDRCGGGGRVPRLRREPGAVRAGLARARRGAHQRLFRPRRLSARCWRSPCSASR